MQATKKQIGEAEKNIKQQEESIPVISNNVNEHESAIQNLQQYSIRDCLKVNGIPLTTEEDITKLTVELGELIGAPYINSPSVSSNEECERSIHSKIYSQ